MAIVERPLTTPSFRLRPAAYLDASWYAVERRHLFDRTWTLVAAVAELDGPGARLGVRVGDQPIVVVRTEDGGLRAFHNTCRHRGMVLCATGEAQPCASTLRCAYHGWEWDLDGTLVRVPQRRTQFPDLDLSAHGLHPASVDEWEGMVFVHPDSDAAPLAEVLGELPAHIGSFRPGRLAQVATARIEVDLNWKLFVENHIDVYHLWYLHDRSLSAFDHSRFEHWALGANWASYEPMRSVTRGRAVEDVVDLDVGTQPIRHLDDRDREGIGAHMVFPNLLMASASEFFATYAIHPLGPDRSWIDLRIRAEADADGEALLAATRSFIDEDVRACRQVQRALASGRFSVGPLARDHERPIARFHDHLLDALAPHLDPHLIGDR